MKKRILCFLTALCMVFGLFPAALASDVNNDAPGDSTGTTTGMTISGTQRTEDGLQFQVTLTGSDSESGDSVLAAVYEKTSGGTTGKMKYAQTVKVTDTVELSDVSDNDIVYLIWMDANYAPRDYKQVSRPAEAQTGVEESSNTVFLSSLADLIKRPDILSAAAEEEMEAKAEADPYTYQRLLVSAEQELPDLSAYGNPSVYFNSVTGYSVIQFTDEENARNCQAYLSALPYGKIMTPHQHELAAKLACMEGFHKFPWCR